MVYGGYKLQEEGSQIYWRTDTEAGRMGDIGWIHL